jgi:DNA-binding XRE family transcriptional regulator
VRSAACLRGARRTERPRGGGFFFVAGVINSDNIRRMKKPSTRSGFDAFWRGRRGLELVSARLLPGRRELEVRFRSGHAYRVEVASLGLEGRAGFAEVGRDPRGVVVGLLDGETIEVPSSAVLAIADPDYRAALTGSARSVGERVRALRLETGRSATEVAEAAGMARSNFARLEAGTHEPRLATLRRVAGALGVPVEALVV